MPSKRLTPVFITGTDTNVGKTVVTGLLASYFLAKGVDVITQKWVQTGCDGINNSDLKRHHEIAGINRQFLAEQLPYCFKGVFSPHLAAAKENAKINIEKIRVDFESLKNNYQSVIAEGAGGVCVPLTRDNVITDLVLRLQLPVVIVAANRLGAINHALLTIEYLRARKAKVIGIIFNNMHGVSEDILRDNPGIVHDISLCPLLGVLPFSENIGQLKSAFIPIGEKIWVALQR